MKKQILVLSLILFSNTLYASKQLCNSNSEDYGSYCKVLPLTINDCKLVNNSFSLIEKSHFESFEKFIPVFYCALKNNNKVTYESRIKFPLPYIMKGTEKTYKGKYSKKKFNNYDISTGDGKELNMAINVEKYRAIAAINWRSGISVIWNFKLKKNKWFLTDVVQGNY